MLLLLFRFFVTLVRTRASLVLLAGTCVSIRDHAQIIESSCFLECFPGCSFGIEQIILYIALRLLGACLQGIERTLQTAATVALHTDIVAASASASASSSSEDSCFYSCFTCIACFLSCLSCLLGRSAHRTHAQLLSSTLRSSDAGLFHYDNIDVCAG
jgi:hypothetical protein